MAHVLASSRYATACCCARPTRSRCSATTPSSRRASPAALQTEMMAAAQRYEDEAEAAVAAIRSVRRRELLRIAAADLLNVTDGLTATAEALTARPGRPFRPRWRWP